MHSGTLKGAQSFTFFVSVGVAKHMSMRGRNVDSKRLFGSELDRTSRCASNNNTNNYIFDHLRLISDFLKTTPLSGYS